MKIFVISLVCALVGGVAGSVQAWTTPQVYPGAVVRTVITPQVKGFAYSSSQYINSVPSAAYSVGLQPQFTYQVPAISGLAPVHTAYYPVASHSIYPTNVFFATVPGVAPAIPAAPTAPESPSQSNPSSSDTTVVDSADQTQAQESSSASIPAQSGQPSRPASTFPNFPSIPQIPQLQDFQQGTQSSFPQVPQAPADADYSQGPGSAPPSFLGSSGGNQGFDDEDTVSVESA